MVDNVRASASSNDGAIFATDDDGTAHHPYVKIEFGANDTQTPVTAAAPLPVEIFDVTGTLVADIGNIDDTLTAVLGSAAITGTSGSAGPANAISIAGTLATGELQEIQMSNATDGFAAATKGVYVFGPGMVYNGAEYDVLREGSETGSLKVDLGNNNDVTLATLPDTAAGDLANLTTVFGSSDMTNPTTLNGEGTGASLRTSSLNYVYNGASWDMCTEGSVAGSLKVDIVADTDGTLGAVNTNTTDIPNVMGTAASAAPSKVLMLGANQGGTVRGVQCSSLGQLYVDLGNNNDVVVTGPEADNAAVVSNPVLMAGRYDITPTTRGDGDVTTFQLNSVGELHVDIENATGVSGSAGPAKAISIAGTDSGGVLREVLMAATGAVHIAGSQTENGAVAYPILGVGGRYDAIARTLGDGDGGALALNASGQLLVDLGTNNAVTLATLPDTAAGDLAEIVNQIQKQTRQEDSSASGTSYGVASFAVRDDALEANASVTADGDYVFTRADNYGALWTTLTDASGSGISPATEGTLGALAAVAATEGSALGSGVLLQGDDGTDRTNVLVDTDGHLQVDVLSGGGGGTQYTIGTDTYLEGTSIGTLAGAVRKDSAASLVNTDNEVTALQVDASGSLRVTGGGGGTEYTEDVAAASNPVGNALILVREDARAGSLTTSDGDNVALRGNNKGEAYVIDTDANALLTTIDGDTGNIATNTTDLPGVIGTSGTAGPAKAISIAGTISGSGNLQEISVSSGGAVNVAGAGADNAAVTGAPVLTAGRYDITPATRDNGDVATLQTNATGSLLVDIAADSTAGLATSALQSTGNSTLGTIDTSLNNIEAGFAAAASAYGSGVLIQGDDGTDRNNIKVDTDGHLQVDVLSGGGGGTQYTIGTDTYLEGTSIGTLAGAVRNDTLATLASLDNEVAPLQVDASGALYIDVASGTVDAVTSLTQMNGQAISMGTGARDAGTQRVTVATNDSVPVTGTFYQATQPVSLASVPSHDVTQATASNLNAQVVGNVASAATDSGNPVKVGAIFNTTQPTVTTGQRVNLQATNRGALIVATGVSNLQNNIAQMNGATVTMGNGASGTGVQRVTIASDSTGQVKLAAGTAEIGKLAAGSAAIGTLAAGSALMGDVGISGARTSGGTTIFRSIDLDEGSCEVVKASAGQIYWIHAMNLSTALRYLKIYNATSGTIGTGSPVLTFPIPTQAATANGAGFVLSIPNGIAFSTGICCGASTGIADADTGAPGANEVVVHIGYA